MFPYITFLGRDYHLYTILGLTAIAVVAVISIFRAKRYEITRQDVIFTAGVGSVGLVLGGGALYFITQIPRLIRGWDVFIEHFPQSLSWVFGGMVFYGGLIGASVGIWASARLFKLNFNALMLIFIPAFPLAHAIMRMGCFMAGCCYGIEHGTLGIEFTRSLAAPNDVPLLPVQLIESAVNLILFPIVWYFAKRCDNWRRLASVYGIMYSIARFLLEFLRGDERRGLLFGLSTSQVISMVLFGVCAYGIARGSKK